MKTSKAILTAISFLAVAGLIGACARTDPNDPGGGGGGCTGSNCLTYTPVPTVAPTTIPTNTPEPTQTPLPPTNMEQCVAACKAKNCATITDATLKAECESDCSTTEIKDGGCATSTFPSDDSDPIVIPEGMSMIHVNVKHCTEFDDALTVQHGNMSFVTQSGESTEALYPGKWKFFAAAGHAHSKRVGDYEWKAVVTVEGTEHAWRQPSALPFDLTKWIPDIDLGKMTIFRAVDVNLPAEAHHGGNEWAKVHIRHYKDERNGETSGYQTYVNYTRKPWRMQWNTQTWTFRYGIKDCVFETKGEFYYFKKSN
jgi:hypothetical protein